MRFVSNGVNIRERESKNCIYDFTDINGELHMDRVERIRMNLPVFAIIRFGLHQRLAWAAVQAQIRRSLRRTIAWICRECERANIEYIDMQYGHTLTNITGCIHIVIERPAGTTLAIQIIGRRKGAMIVRCGATIVMRLAHRRQGASTEIIVGN